MSESNEVTMQTTISKAAVIAALGEEKVPVALSLYILARACLIQGILETDEEIPKQLFQEELDELVEKYEENDRRDHRDKISFEVLCQHCTVKLIKALVPKTKRLKRNSTRVWIVKPRLYYDRPNYETGSGNLFTLKDKDGGVFRESVDFETARIWMARNPGKYTSTLVAVEAVEQGDVATARVQTWGYMDGFEAVIVPNSAGAGIEGESQEFLKECDADTWLEERINNLSQEGDEKIEGYIMPKKIFVPKPA